MLCNLNFSFAKNWEDTKPKKGKKTSDSTVVHSKITVKPQLTLVDKSIASPNECIAFNLISEKKIYKVAEPVEVSIILKLYDVAPTAAVEEDCKKFSINVALPKSFKQTGGDYKEFTNVSLSKTASEITFKIIGEFVEKDSIACFILMKGPANSNPSTIFVKKKEYCIQAIPADEKPTEEKPNSGKPEPPVTNLSPCIVGQTVDRDVICVGESVTLTASNCTGSASWVRHQYDVNNNYVTSQTLTSATNILEDVLTVAGFFSYNAPDCLTGQTTCSTGGLLRITVKAGTPQIVTSPTISPNVLCGTSSTTLTVSNCSGTVHWYQVIESFSVSSNTQLLQLSVGTNTLSAYGDTYYFAKCEVGCSLSQESNRVYSSNNHTPTIVSSSTAFCTGGTPVTLTATGCTPYETIYWSNGMTGASIEVVPQSSTNYYSKCNQYDQNGIVICDNTTISNVISITVSTGSSQTPTVNPVVKNVCASETASTTITASGCSTGYLWSTGATTASISVTPTQTTVYTVRCGTTASCLGPPVTSTINIYTTPVPTTPTIASSLTITSKEIVNCSNQAFTLTGGNCNGTLDWYWRPHNNLTYTYLNSDPSITVTNSTHVVYSVACRTTCRSTVQYGDYVVLYPPVGNVTAESNSPLNLGQTLNLTSSASNTTYSSTVAYSWAGPNSFTSVQQNPSVSSVVPNSAGIYTATVTNTKCPATATTNVVILDCVAGSGIATTNPLANPSNGSTSQNNIVENLYLKGMSVVPNANVDNAQTITYLDGFGRVAQVVNTGMSPTGKDIVSPVEYDAFGRVTKSYLPYAATTSNGSYKAAAITEQATFYTTLKADNKAYSEAILESSPVEILKQQGFVGTSWQPNTSNPTIAKTLKADFKHTSETKIRKFAYNYTTSTWTINTYGANELLVSETKDIDNNKVEEFTDFTGNVVCKRVTDAANSTTLTTYNAYDGFNRLAFVFPPATAKYLVTPDVDPVNGLANGNLNPNLNVNFQNYIFAYVYDKRGRIISTKAPDAAVQEVVYDPLDRPVLQRDGLNASATIPVWKYTKYDELGRVHSTGTIASSSTQATLQASADAYYASAMQYGANGYPTSSPTELVRNYYDSYNNFIQPYTNGTLYSVAKPYNLTTSNSVNGKLVGVKENTLLPTGATALTKTQLTTGYYYDNLGQMVQSIAEDHNGKLIVTTQNLDFAGRSERTEQLVGLTFSTTYTTKVGITKKYDQGGRVKVVFQQLNNDMTETVGKYTYNEIGELTNTLQGCDIQNIAYKFDIQGKLTDINEVNTTNLNTQKKFFGEKLTYNFNGTINKAEWGSIPAPNAPAGSLPPTRSFTYSYDYLYRMTGAAYAGKAGEDFSATTSYDVNGNISTLTRKRGAVTEDNLTYTYGVRSNKLLKVADANTTASTTGWFKDGVNASDDYTYDASGNVKTDLNRGITGIDYNYLNLPERISFSNGTFVRYIYTATGDKIRREHHDGVKTDYIGGLVYKNSAIEFIGTAEGRAIPDGATFRYEYQTSDHLGNLRSTYYKNKTAPVGTEPLTLLQENHYDPWGINLTDIETVYVNSDRFQYNGLSEKAILPNGSYDYDTDFRQYDPQIGRFKAIDPLADFAGSINPYNFGFNNPISFNDPLGLFPFGGPRPKNPLKVSTATGININFGNGTSKLPSDGSGGINWLNIGTVAANVGINLGAKAITKATAGKINTTVNTANSKNSTASVKYSMDADYNLYNNPIFKGDRADMKTEALMLGVSYTEYLEMGLSGRIPRHPSISHSETGDWVDIGFSFASPNKGIGLLAKINPLARVSALKKIVSMVKSDERLLNLAEKTFEGNAKLQKEANNLIQQMANGNMNPGAGTKFIGNGVFELRGKTEGARVYFRHAANETIEILGYSHKGNQQEVINKIFEIFY